MGMGTAAAWLAAAVAMAGAASAETGQQIYDRAQAAFDRGEWAQAIVGFRQALTIAPGGRAGGLIRTRLAHALIGSGRIAEAHAAAGEAVALLAAKSPPLDADLAGAYLTLGEAARIDLDYPTAIRAYDAAQAHAPAEIALSTRRAALMGITLSAATTEPDLAARSADEIIADPAIFDASAKDARAALLGVRARIELNRGAPKAALPFLRRSLALHGPLTRKVSLQDVAIRADAALVYQLLGDEENTKRYLAYTGAGHLPSNDWMAGARDLPVCGTDIRPEDTAIVEFGITADGGTSGAAPVYVSRPGEMGTAFAETVRKWRWNRDAVAKLDPFWRSVVRMQLRCVTRPPATQLSAPFEDAGIAWLATLTTAAEDEYGRPDFAAHDAAPADLKLLSAAIEKTQDTGDAKSWATGFAALDAILVRMAAPLEVRAYVAMICASADKAGSLKQHAVQRNWRLSTAIPLVDAMPDSARAAAWLRAELAISLETAGRFADARPLLDAVERVPLADLPAEDPIRKVAILHQSLLDRVAGNHQAADARLKGAGVGTAECALFDVQPVPTNAAIASSQFPVEAMRWGFEGMAREAFDIAPDGTVQNVRTVIAYPPFVFARATEQAVARFRYLPPTLGSAVLGCANQNQTVRFGLPNR